MSLRSFKYFRGIFKRNLKISGSQTDTQKMVPKSDKERDQAVAEAKEAAKAEFDKALDLVSI